MDYKTQDRIFLILERFWLVAAILCAVLSAYFIATGDNDSALFFLGLFIISALFYLLRKRQRARSREHHTLRGNNNGNSEVLKKK